MKLVLLLSIAFFSKFLAHGQDFQILSQLPLDDNFSFSTLGMGKNGFGMGLLNNKGVMVKEQELQLIPAEAGLLADKILLMNYKQIKPKGVGYIAKLVDKKTLAVVQEKSVFEKNSPNHISSTLLKNPANKVCYAIFHETKNLQGFRFKRPADDFIKSYESLSFQLVSVNEQFEFKTIEIKTEAASSNFADACADQFRNIYICSFSNSSIVVEKFDSTGRLLGKLSTPFSIWKIPALTIVMKNDLFDQSTITIAATHLNSDKKEVHQVIRYDFTNKKLVTTGEIVLDKNYRQSLKNPNEEAKARFFPEMDCLVPIQIFEDASQVIVVKEIIFERLGGKGEGITRYRDGSIITVYNKKNLEVERDIVINKYLATFVESSAGINAHLVGKQLWAVTCENSGLASFKSYSYKINVATGEVLKEEIEKDDIGKGWVTFPHQIAWFKKNYVVPFHRVTSPFAKVFETAFVTRTY